MQPRLILVVIIGLAALAGSGLAALPLVENVNMVQRPDGSGLVDVSYDLIEADGDLCTVTLQVSHDGGASWVYPAWTVSGDVGPGVAAGTGRGIVWDLGVGQASIVGSDFRARVIASDVGVGFAVHSPRNVAITDFSAVNWADPATVEKFSRADLCLVMGHHLWKGGASADIEVVAQLKALNPAIVILAYVSVKSAHMSGLTSDPESYWYKWYERTSPYFMFTTAGDTAQDWPNSRLINILEPGCRQAMIETIVEMQTTSLNIFDGVYWDYFNNSLWIPPWMDVEGDPDMDGDGIPHAQDADEMQAYRDAQISLVQALRDSLGQDFIQFFNGQRAYEDMDFAALADGAMYELFPTLFFPDPDMGSALSPGYQYSLMNVRPFFRTRNGGPYLVMANPWVNRYIDQNDKIVMLNLGDMFRAIALVTDTFASWNVETYAYGWSAQDLSLGSPLGPPVFDGSFIRRDFEFGDVEIEMGNGFYPNAFDYKINILGTRVEELRVPFHYP